MNGIFALSMAETFGSGDFPQPSSIIRMTFLFIAVCVFSPDGSGNHFCFFFKNKNIATYSWK
jgi:hypothetical protein